MFSWGKPIVNDLKKSKLVHAKRKILLFEYPAGQY
jgi:hypothetical protein